MKYKKVIVAVIFLASLFYFIFDIGSAAPPGLSMAPLFAAHDKYLILRWWTKINRYDIVLVQEPDRDDRLLIKRVVGLPGETLELKKGKLFVNGKPLPEPYIKNTKQRGVENYIIRSGSARITIPEKSYFFLGDNRDNSYDSRYFGPLHEKHIQGKILGIFWPVSHAKIF